MVKKTDKKKIAKIIKKSTYDLYDIKMDDVKFELKRLQSFLESEMGVRESLNPFFSPKEAFGKIAEEYHEVLHELHMKDDPAFYAEVRDLACVCVRALASRGKVVLTEHKPKT